MGFLCLHAKWLSCKQQLRSLFAAKHRHVSRFQDWSNVPRHVKLWVIGFQHKWLSVTVYAGWNSCPSQDMDEKYECLRVLRFLVSTICEHPFGRRPSSGDVIRYFWDWSRWHKIFSRQDATCQLHQCHCGTKLQTVGVLWISAAGSRQGGSEVPSQTPPSSCEDRKRDPWG